MKLVRSVLTSLERWGFAVLFGLEAIWVGGVGTIVLLFAESSAEFDGEALNPVVLPLGLLTVWAGAALLAISAVIAAPGLPHLPRAPRIAALIGAGALNVLALPYFAWEAVDLVTNWAYWQDLGFGTYDVVWSAVAICVTMLGALGSIRLSRRGTGNRVRPASGGVTGAVAE